MPFPGPRRVERLSSRGEHRRDRTKGGQTKPETLRSRHGKDTALILLKVEMHGSPRKEWTENCTSRLFLVAAVSVRDEGIRWPTDSRVETSVVEDVIEHSQEVLLEGGQSGLIWTTALPWAVGLSLAVRGDIRDHFVKGPPDLSQHASPYHELPSGDKDI